MSSLFRRSAVVPVVLALAAAAGCSPQGQPNSGDSVANEQRVVVDRPGKSRAPVRSAAGTVTMEYFGGTVVENPKVYVVWWGNPANINSAVTAAHGGIADFYAGVTNSNFMDWLNEYNTTVPANAGSHKGSPGTNQRIGRGNYAGALTLANIPAGNVTDAQIQSTLDAAFAANTLPQPDANTLYAIYFPPGVTINLGGSTSCSAFGAYHESTIETVRHNAYYLVMPDCGGGFTNVTIVSAHELVEAITDNIPTPGSNPDFPQAWNDASGSETGDLCESSSGTVATPLGTFTVQGIWDEKSQGCKVSRTDAQDFSVALSPNTATIASGASATFTVQTATTAGAAQPLTLSATAPAGLTATLSSSTVNTGGTATLTVTAGSPAVLSGLQVVVRADGAAGETHSASLLVTVSSGGPTNDFSLSAAPASVSVAQGASGSATISSAITSGSAESIALSVSGAPSGVTATLSPASISSGQSATLSLAATSSAVAGNYALVITGTAATGSHTASVSLTITSGGTGGGTSITNGDFETGTLSGWTATGAAETVATAGCHGGTHCAQLGSTSATNGDSSIAQTFTAAAGVTGLSLWYKETCPDTVTYDWALATLKDNTAGTTATLIAKACATNAWTNVTSALTAGHSYTVTLTSHDDNYASDPTFTLFDDVATTSSAPPPSGINNGTFETGSLTGWTATGAASSAVTGGHSGTYAARLGSTAATNGDSSIAQTFTVPAGKSQLSLWYKIACPDTLTYDWATVTLKNNGSGTTATVLAKTCTNSAAWVNVTSAVTAGGSYTLTLTSHDDNYAGDPTYTLFDDVTLN